MIVKRTNTKNPGYRINTVGAKNNDKLNELKNITVNISKDVELADIKKSISKLSESILMSSENISRIKTKVIIGLNTSHDFGTYSYDTVQEINEKLNSDSDFITIGDLVLKRKSIESIWKTSEEYKGGNNLYSKLNDGETKLKSATVEELLETIMRKPIPVDYDSKKQVKSYIEKLIECYEKNFKYI